MVLWTLCIGIELIYSILILPCFNNNSKLIRGTSIFLYILYPLLSVPFPIATVVVCFVLKEYMAEQPFCWIGPTDAYRVAFMYAWVWAIMLFVLLAVLLVVIAISRKLSLENRTVVAVKLFCYVIIYVLVWVFPTLNRFIPASPGVARYLLDFLSVRKAVESLQ